VICFEVCKAGLPATLTIEVGLRALKFGLFLPEVNWLLHNINAIKHNNTNIEYDFIFFIIFIIKNDLF